ncbi:GNAT family N-acetyltransferase [Arenimonas caeni]|jgi:RimJ/RimL family protein N-acetyltransferase|uniref:GNAT family N-acetyltransferase n=1 Tax=Arenimonas caeni TaxID=2058085 RepID=UPI002A36D1F0|nr:GNAT family N-acetyltransferase [Arenimonas caeni]MDY0021475.1 GNAT family N-acetyltransferase [Arenimonas caeni]
MPQPLPESDRLRLRELRADDAGFLLELLNDPDFIANIGDRGVRTPEQARAYLEAGALAGYREHGYSMWAVEAKPGGEVAGVCGVIRRDTLPEPDIGYAFLPAWRGRGLAGEAAQLVLAHAFGALQLPRLLAIVNETNLASRRLLESLGMRSLGLRQVGKDELVVYSIERPG